MTFWIAAVDRNEREPDWEEVRSTSFRTAVSQALLRFGARGDWTIAKDETWPGVSDHGAGTELAYHAEEYPDVLFVRTAGLPAAQSANTQLTTIEDLRIERAPEDLAAQWVANGHGPMRSARLFHGCQFPAELQNFDNFEDTTDRSDATSSVQFSIGDEVYRVWVAPLRPFDRSADIREQEAKAFQVAEHEVEDGDVERALENANAWASDVVFETDNVAMLEDYFARIWNARATQLRQQGAAAGRAAASPERLLGLAAAALAPYNGWAIEYHPDAKLWEVRHPQSDLYLQFALDRPDNGTISWVMFDQEAPDDGVDAGTVRFPTQGRDAQQLQNVLKPIMDRYQPAPEYVDSTSARFKQLELDRGPRRTATAPDVDDTAERFKLLELNGGKKLNPAAAKVYRLQKVIGTLQRDLAPPNVKGGVLSSPDQLVGQVLAPFLEDRSAESFVTVFVNVRNKIIGYLEYTMGSATGVSVDVSGILREGLQVGAAGFVTAHNHPSGDPTPSTDDRALWERLRAAGELLGVPCVDNLVVGGDGRFFSESQDGYSRVTVQRRAAAEKNPAYPIAGELQQQTITQLTGNPLEVHSASGLEGTFARSEDAEFFADELRRSGARNVKVEKRTRTRSQKR